MEAPRLSVIIPVYNGEGTLGDQLRALRRQPSSFAWEVLVCDNGSTDGTLDLVRNWQADWPELRTIDASARRGPSFARNSGARAAAAPFLAFCDADDVVGDGWVVSMHAALTDHPFVAGSLDGKRLNAGHKASLSWSTDGSFTKPFLPWLAGAPSGNMGIRKSVFDQVGGFEESLPTNEDTDLSWRVQLAGYELRHHPEIVLHVRRRDGLRPVFRQAYSYGAGDRQLRRRYAQVIDAYQAASAPGAPGQPEPATHDLTGLLSRVLNKARRVRRPADLADQVWRVGYWLGERRGAGELSTPPVVVPQHLPFQG